MPGIGLALWSSETPASPGGFQAKVFLQAAPNPSTGLPLPGNFLEELRRQFASIEEAGDATPARAIQAFQTCDVLVFLCHGKIDGTPYLELAPPTPGGRLTIRDLDAMPSADRVQAVLLGACWTSLEVRHAAEQVEGFASMLLLKGVRAVLAGTGEIYIGLISEMAIAILANAHPAGSIAELARRVHKRQRNFREELIRNAAPNRQSLRHPWHWASLVFYGVPWI